MTILAGAFARRPRPLPPALCDDLHRAISRNPHDAPVVFQDDRVLLLKVDIGAYSGPAVHAPGDGSASMLAGEPLLAASGAPSPTRTRAQDLLLLHERLSRGDTGIAALTRGAFCLVHYQPAQRAGPHLTLLTDRLGVRPLYYWLNADLVVWASALRILEAVTEMPRHMDLRAVAEMACLGVPLGSRTPYHGIHALRSAEAVSVDSDRVSNSQYWRWDDVPLTSRPAHEQLQRMRDEFTDAVACRARQDTCTTAFLSGGLDSRTVVAALRERGLRVRTMCFGLPGTQDQVLAAAFARAAGTEHRESPLRPDEELRFSDLMAAALNDPSGSPGGGAVPERPRMVWSGDGGSMPLGHIYLNAAMVDLLRSGDSGAAIDAYLHQQQAFVSRRLLQPDIGESLATLLREGVAEELADIHCVDPGRGLYLFLLLNDQRRHLATHFEDIDRHRVELQLPYYDAEFLRTVLETQVDWGLYHRLYMDWLRLMPPVITSVPWQTYPGHITCPLPLPDGLRYQWDLGRYRDVRRLRKRPLLARARQLLSAARFPRELVRRERLRLATWLYRVGLADYAYVIRQAGLIYRYWERCGGRWVVPDRETAALTITQPRRLAPIGA